MCGSSGSESSKKLSWEPKFSHSYKSELPFSCPILNVMYDLIDFVNKVPASWAGALKKLPATHENYPPLVGRAGTNVQPLMVSGKRITQ